jgi:release factor glutamine methyltransferase
VNGVDEQSFTAPGTVRQLLASASKRLRSAPEARWIVAQATAIAPAEVLTRLDTPVSAAERSAVMSMVERRVAGEPLQYVIGTWSFRSLDVHVDRRALVPRAETEQVVEVALEELRRVATVLHATGANDTLVVADLGTGSGVIALSLAVEAGAVVPGKGTRWEGARPQPGIEVWATDVSSSALELAQLNLSAVAVSRPGPASHVRLSHGSWFAALPAPLAGHVHLVVSNPPYVSATEWTTLDPDVRDHEPRSALVPGDTGLEALALLVDQARRWLAPGGSLVAELAPHQADVVRHQAEDAGYGEVMVRPDLAGRSRVLVVRWSDG